MLGEVGPAGRRSITFAMRAREISEDARKEASE